MFIFKLFRYKFSKKYIFFNHLSQIQKYPSFHNAPKKWDNDEKIILMVFIGNNCVIWIQKVFKFGSWSNNLKLNENCLSGDIELYFSPILAAHMLPSYATHMQLLMHTDNENFWPVPSKVIFLIIVTNFYNSVKCSKKL